MCVKLLVKTFPAALFFGGVDLQGSGPLRREDTLFSQNNVDQWFCYVEKGRGCVAPPCKTSSMTNCVCLRGEGGKCGFELMMNECSF